jgi:hypothetical protein
MAPTPFQTPPATAEWDRTITHKEYNNMLKGFVGQTMEDKWQVNTDAPDAQGNTVVHMSFGWSPRERFALDISISDPKNTEAKDFATIVKISWADEELPVGSGRKIYEYDAKNRAVNLCNGLLGCALEKEDPDEYEDLDEDGNPIPDDHFTF